MRLGRRCQSAVVAAFVLGALTVAHLASRPPASKPVPALKGAAVHVRATLRRARHATSANAGAPARPAQPLQGGRPAADSPSPSPSPSSSSSSSSPEARHVAKLREQLDAIPWHDYTREEVLAALRKATSSGSSAGAISAGAGSAGTSLWPFSAKAQRRDLTQQLRFVLKMVSGAAPSLRCAHDGSLPDVLPPPPPAAGGGAVLVAVNFHNNEALLPHFIRQLAEVLGRLGARRAYVSVYESGSEDATGAWLELLRHLLQALGVEHRIVTGGEQRREDQNRIDFLAEMRNRALEPLWLERQQGAGAASSEGHAFDNSTRVLFMNDVYFCADHVLRLLLQEGDLVCAMDFNEQTADHPSYPSQLMKPFGDNGPHLTGQYEMSDQLLFYDTWVARDINGLPLSNFRPYVSHAYSLARLAAGLPLPAKCCWNGLAVVSAAPFLAGVRFRNHRFNECRASEISLLCDDFLRLGFTNIVVDPGVRVAYEVKVAEALYTPRVSSIANTTWADVAKAKPIDWRYVPERALITCCDTGDDPSADRMVDWGACHPVDIFELDAVTQPMLL